jgi:hypothetical protein
VEVAEQLQLLLVQPLGVQAQVVLQHQDKVLLVVLEPLVMGLVMAEAAAVEVQLEVQVKINLEMAARESLFTVLLLAAEAEVLATAQVEAAAAERADVEPMVAQELPTLAAAVVEVLQLILELKMAAMVVQEWSKLDIHVLR